MLAWFNAARSWWDPAEAAHLDRALELASKAVTLDPQDSFCWQFRANIHLYRREHDLAEHCMRQALARNPNDLRVVAGCAEVLVHLGYCEEALEAMRSVQDFEPLPPTWHWEVLGMVLFGLGRSSEAAESFRRLPIPSFWRHAYLAACYGQLGDSEKAQRHLTAYMADAPDPSIEGYIKSDDFFKNPEDREPWLEGLRKAGLREHAD